MDDLSSYKTLYLSTAKTNIESIQRGLDALLQNLTDEVAVEEVFRNAHTLKSKSYLMGEKEIGDLAKTIEDTFYAVKNKTSSLSKDLVTSSKDQVSQIEKKI